MIDKLVQQGFSKEMIEDAMQVQHELSKTFNKAINRGDSFDLYLDSSGYGPGDVLTAGTGMEIVIQSNPLLHPVLGFRYQVRSLSELYIDPNGEYSWRKLGTFIQK